jgi:Ca2+-binding EF-hand superfamily protein
MNATRLLTAAAVAALFPLAGAFAQGAAPDQGAAPQTPPSQSTPSQGSQQGATFESLDTNSDGRISKTEAAANESVSAQFSKYDKDGNGYIERSEVNNANRDETPQQ